MPSKRLWLLLITASLVLLSFSALAQQEDPSTLYERVTRYDVTDADVIEAGLDTPMMTPVDVQRHDRQASLIRLREDFRQRVLTSARGL